MLHDVPEPLPLNQRTEGACVGFGWSAQLAVGPIHNPTDNVYAQDYYRSAVHVDRAAGRYWAVGASVLAGAQVARRRKVITGYRWAFGIDDVIDTLVVKGPVLLGLNWYDSMYRTRPDGRVRVDGSIVGGHCILATGYIHLHPRWGGSWIEWVNSWGPTYGVDGKGYIRATDLGDLLQQSGEACIADEVQPRRPEPNRRRALPGVTSTGSPA